MKRLGYVDGTLDRIDVRIISELGADARMTASELGRRVGLSAPSVSERMRRLEEAGVIEGYTASISPRAVGLDVGVWIRIRPLPGQLDKVAELVRDQPEIVECDRVTGDDCFLARAYVRSVADVERLIDRILPYAQTNTAVIQSSPVPRRLPSLMIDAD